MSAPTDQTANKDANAETRFLAEVDKLLQEGKLDEAENRLGHAKSLASSLRVRNARGVLLLRRGKAEQALDYYRNMVLKENAIDFREDVPRAAIVNFATAMLLCRRIGGGEAILDRLRPEDHPGVQRLRDSISAWERQLSFMQRINRKIGGDPSTPITFSFPPGELI